MAKPCGFGHAEARINVRQALLPRGIRSSPD